MKNALIWLFITSTLLTNKLLAQGQDSLSVQEQRPPRVFTLRVGTDMMRLVRTQTNPDFQGFELVGDLQLNRRWFVATEIGAEKVTRLAEQINYTTSGSYFKVGVDYNFFKNWEGMNNNMYIGFRYARSLHRHTVNNYQLYSLNQYVTTTTTNGYAIGERDPLGNGWFEFIFGIKVALLKNLYAGISLRMGGMLVNPQPDNFGNLYAPGFNKITDDNKFGSNINYTLTYAFPFRFRKGAEANKDE